MNLNRTFRRVHYWSTLFVALTAGMIALTGLLLVVRKDVEWLQPAVRAASSEGPSDATVRALYDAARRHDPELDWRRVDRIDVRLGQGVAKVITDDYREIQVDIHDLRVLNAGYRGGDLVEHIHDTTILHPDAKYWLMIPTAIALLVMWATGLYMFAVTQIARARKRRQSHAAALVSSPPKATGA